MKPLIWIIDEEWADYEIENHILKENFPDCEIRYSKNNYKNDLDNFGKKADAIICQVYVDMPKEVIDQLENCKIIAVYGGGYDRVNINAAKEKGIKVTYVPGYCIEDVSDYVISAIYYANKKLGSYDESILNGLWGAQAVSNPGKRINQSSLLIIGFGRIGKTVARKALSIGMTVLIYDPHVDKKTAESFSVKKVELQEGLQNADYVSINTKLYKESEGLLGIEEFKVMKDTAYIINTARGKIMVEEDLIEAVEKGIIGGAVLDVISNEPPIGNEKIFKCSNILVTPHISYISRQSLDELKYRASNNVVKVLNGEATQDFV